MRVLIIALLAAISYAQTDDCESIKIMDGESTCGALAQLLGDLCDSDYGASDGPCSCMCEPVCEGKTCVDCLDHTDFACSYYDGNCISSTSMKDPSQYTKKFVWFSDDCPNASSKKQGGNVCEGKSCASCLDETDYACSFYDGKCLLSSSMKNPADFKASKFVWSSSKCPASINAQNMVLAKENARLMKQIEYALGDGKKKKKKDKDDKNDKDTDEDEDDEDKDDDDEDVAIQNTVLVRENARLRKQIEAAVGDKKKGKRKKDKDSDDKNDKDKDNEKDEDDEDKNDDDESVAIQNMILARENARLRKQIEAAVGDKKKGKRKKDNDSDDRNDKDNEKDENDEDTNDDDEDVALENMALARENARLMKQIEAAVGDKKKWKRKKDKDSDDKNDMNESEDDDDEDVALENMALVRENARLMKQIEAAVGDKKKRKKKKDKDSDDKNDMDTNKESDENDKDEDDDSEDVASRNMALARENTRLKKQIEAAVSEKKKRKKKDKDNDKDNDSEEKEDESDDDKDEAVRKTKALSLKSGENNVITNAVEMTPSVLEASVLSFAAIGAMATLYFIATTACSIMFRKHDFVAIREEEI